MALQEQAWYSRLVVLDETAQWNFEDWPPLEGGWRRFHAAVVLNHPGTEDNHNKRQTVFVLGGHQTDQGYVNSVLSLNLADPDRQWREGPPMNQSRRGHAAVVCNGGVYVMGGMTRYSSDCIERIDANELVQSSLTTTAAHESHWTTLPCCLSTQRFGCCAVAIHNRYILVMGGYDRGRRLSSVDIMDTLNDTVIAGLSMTVPRSYCASAVIGRRIFVVGGHNGDDDLDSVEYLDYATPCHNDNSIKETGSTFISFSSTWIAHSELVLSNARRSCAGVAVGSGLVMAGGHSRTVGVLDVHRNRMWNLPPSDNGSTMVNHRHGSTMVPVANQIAVIGGFQNPNCATLPLLDKNSWCFRRLCDRLPNGWYNATGTSSNTPSTRASDSTTAKTHSGDKEKDET